MKEKIIKATFVSGKTVFIKGEAHTKTYSKDEEDELRNVPFISNERLKKIDDYINQALKETSPDFHKKLYPQQYED